MSEAFIVDAVRVAGGRRKGRLANVHAADLGAMSLDAPNPAYTVRAASVPMR